MKKEAKKFAVFWTVTFLVFFLMVIWTFIFGSETETGTANFWVHAALMLLISISFAISIIGMWIRYMRGEFQKMRQARNLSFYVVILIFPLGILINLIIANL